MIYEPSDADLQNMYDKIGFKVDNAEFDFFRSLEGAHRDEDEVYLKVFSYMGRKDAAAGDALHQYLEANGVTYKTHNPRSAIFKIADFNKLFGLEAK